jgi:hypothetical protein
MIVNTVRAYNETKTVDISKETRLERCQQCFNEMKNIKEILGQLSVSGKLGKLISETTIELSAIE